MGDARWDERRQTGRIRLSAVLWPKASPAEREEVVVHETCHIIDWLRHGPEGWHGPEWRNLMMRCGYPEPKRGHAVDRAAILARRRRAHPLVRLYCGCPDGVLLGPVIAKRIQNGEIYRCRTRACIVRMEPYTYPVVGCIFRL
jgi:predicted SprT family Zn-dependent metalloprotease